MGEIDDAFDRSLDSHYLCHSDHGLYLQSVRGYSELRSADPVRVLSRHAAFRFMDVERPLASTSNFEETGLSSDE
jgi:hypothetical protein